MNFDNIPQDLKELDRWVCWRWEKRQKSDGSPDDPAKTPINPITGGRAMSNNPATWGTYQDAVNAANAGKIRDIDVCGIGFMFNGDGIVGVDIDHCIAADTGKLSDSATDIISTLDSYTEWSQSGKGVHIICYGKLPEGGRRKSSVEMYNTGRYFIVTGNILDDAHGSIEERTDELAAVHDKYINAKKQSKNAQKGNKSVNNAPVFVTDDEIIEIALNAKNGNLFADLMNGNWKGTYSSGSEADLALCNMLAFYTGKDTSIMDRIFRRSGLFRDKWDERRGEGGTYGDITIAKAIRDCSETYTSPKPRKEPAALPEDPGIDNGLDHLVKEASASAKKTDFTSDLGRSKIFSDKHKDILRWCGDMKLWLMWSGKQWQADRTLQVMQLAKDTIEEIIITAGKAVGDATGEDAIKKAKQAYKDALKAKSERCIKSMLELAKSDLPITVNQLDADPYMLNCQNGIVDLRTGLLQPHRADLFMTKIAYASYMPGKSFGKFGKFLQDITCNDADLADYFKQVCGMAAIGKVFYEGMCMFYGSGRNGKSTFLNCVTKIFGDYACSINPEVLMSQRDGRQQAGGVSVEGKRFVTAMESEEGRRISGSMLKKLASTDPMTERPLYQNERTFDPSHTLIMATNHLPKVSSTDAGTWRRIAVVPFKARFEGRGEIKDYASVLYNTDADAILTWIVDGAMQYIANGYNIKMPSVVEQATKDYRAAEDWLGNFMQECCETGEYEESGGNLFDAYKNWCMQNNESYVRRSRDFAQALEQQGFERKRTMHGSIWYGVRLINNADATSLSKYRSAKSKQSSFVDLDDDELDAYTRSKM